ncbi:MAG: hypothetical protein HC887_05860 [Desulfobacteraceae bacterium]|nr:hypothetical protein [Desulfobacteraceae bacterium]
MFDENLLQQVSAEELRQGYVYDDHAKKLSVFSAGLSIEKGLFIKEKMFSQMPN